jgi:hypothetical protein
VPNLVISDAAQRSLDLHIPHVPRLPQSDGGPIGLSSASFDSVLQSDLFERARLARKAKHRAKGL